MFILLFIQLIGGVFFSTKESDYKDYTIIFEQIDNRVELFVNDSLVFDSESIDGNPELGSTMTIYLGYYLTPQPDEIKIKLFNGFEPYNEQDDKHWEIRYMVKEGKEEYDYFWDYNDENQIGLVLEETFYL